ncbi:synaptic vesicle membrane protein VAT-1 homolog isoform X2 [Eriocheir sinensis]|uniref:synaptic vesicle membrane protein VAT-1 homolog isoform X2 n=1 Tax=Eriocheir sinensis TaxID=95602 RepID=UPI0021C972ED|nr:synaptic vesicle membrane protein VAT-1 homolog isoform X2 [Eriocheir sinensis]
MGRAPIQVEEGESTPDPLAHQVTVSVKACGLNFYDIYVRQGLSPYVQPPCTIGLECAGVVTAVGTEVTTVKAGDHVAVHCPTGGACAEQITVDCDSVLVVPDDMSFEVASSFTVTYLTAYFSIFHQGGLREGGAVLIHSAAGGVGWAATQLAKTVPGVTVFGTASQYKHQAIKKNGVDFPIHYDQDYEAEVLKQRPQGVSVVLDNLSGTDFTKSQNLLEPLGKVVLIGARSMVGKEHRNLWQLFKVWWTTKNISPYPLIMKNYGIAGFNLNELRDKNLVAFTRGWKEILDMITSKKLHPRVDSVWQFEDIVDAFKQMSERKNIGKVVVKP